jgi:hypothetical protein
MDWHTEKFRQPIAAMESPMTGNWGGHSFEGDGCASASVRQVMGQLRSCRVPDDWLLQNRRALLFGRDVLKAVMAAFTSGSQAA